MLYFQCDNVTVNVISFLVSCHDTLQQVKHTDNNNITEGQRELSVQTTTSARTALEFVQQQKGILNVTKAKYHHL